MQETTKSTRVQELISQIRDQGVHAAAQEAERILREARAKASEIVAQAKAESESLKAETRADIEAQHAAAHDALQLAARDTVLELKARVTARFEEFIKRLVVSATRDEEFVRNIVLVLAGHAAQEFIQDKQIEVRISSAFLTGNAEFKEEARDIILGLSSDMLREGVELIPDAEVKGGARVKLVADKLEIDLSDRAVSRMIAQRILPRFKAIVKDAE
jgi:V/A-type H+/Na+-transporting ATPase subunit E